MFTVISVWVLVTIGGYNSNTVTYSPPMADLAICQHLQNSVKDLSGFRLASQCVEIRVKK